MRNMMLTEKDGVDCLELGKGIVEGEDLRRADEGEVAVEQRLG